MLWLVTPDRGTQDIGCFWPMQKMISRCEKVICGSSHQQFLVITPSSTAKQKHIKSCVLVTAMSLHFLDELAIFLMLWLSECHHVLSSFLLQTSFMLLCPLDLLPSLTSSPPQISFSGWSGTYNFFIISFFYSAHTPALHLVFSRKHRDPFQLSKKLDFHSSLRH